MAKSAKNSLLYWALLIGFLFLTFVGTSPFSQGHYYETTSDSMSRVIIVLLFLGSLLLAWRYRKEVLGCILDNVVLFSLIAFCCLSVLWSQYPFVTVKRALILVFIAVTALGLAAATKDLRQFHTALFVTLTGVVLANFLFAAVAPSQAISHHALQGFYPEKNAAGAMAMIAVVAAGSWLAGTTSSRDRFFGIFALVVSLIFLILTKSKTSTGLAFLALLVFYTFLAVQRFGEPVALFVIALAFAALAAVLLVLALVDYETGEVFSWVFSDSSFTGRDELWAFTYDSASSRPLLGHGYGAFWDVGKESDPLNRLEPGTWLGDVEPGVINQAHNGYLELWLHIGLPAMIIAVVTVVSTIFVTGRAAISGVADTQPQVAFGMVAVMLCVYLLHNSMEASLLMREQPFCNFALLLTFLATHRKSLRTNHRTGVS